MSSTNTPEMKLPEVVEPSEVVIHFRQCDLGVKIEDCAWNRVQFTVTLVPAVPHLSPYLVKVPIRIEDWSFLLPPKPPVVIKEGQPLKTPPQPQVILPLISTVADMVITLSNNHTSQTLLLDWNPLHPEPKPSRLVQKIKVIADPDNTISESDETNNFAVGTA